MPISELLNKLLNKAVQKSTQQHIKQTEKLYNKFKNCNMLDNTIVIDWLNQLKEIGSRNG